MCVKAGGMAEPWHLAASDGSLSAPSILRGSNRIGLDGAAAA